MSIESNDSFRCTLAEACLKDVLDPEIGLNVVDLGLIYKIWFDASEKKIDCTMTFTTAYCPMGESIFYGVRDALCKMFPGDRVKVEVVYEPEWGPDRISDEGKIFLAS